MKTIETEAQKSATRGDDDRRQPEADMWKSSLGDEPALLRRTAVTAGVLVGASTLWVGLLSLVLVSLAGHAFSDTGRPGLDTPSTPAAHAPATPRARPVSP